MTKVNLNIPLEDIPKMPFHDLYALYIALFNRPNKCTRKELYIWQVTNRLQELRFGGLDKETRHLLENMDENYSPQPERSVPVGVELIKKYKGETYKIKVLKNGYEWNNEVFKSLSAIALKITGRTISGQEFFGVHHGHD